MPGMGEEIPKGAYNKYGDADRKVAIGSIGKHGTFMRIPYADITDGGSLIERRLGYAVGIDHFRPVTRKREPTLAKIEN